MKNVENLSKQEQEAFQKLGEVSMPTGLEDEMAIRLESENLFNKRQKEFTMKNWIYTVAASVAFFVLGYFLAPLDTASNSEPTGLELPQYAILLFEDDSFKGDDQALMSEYMAWGQDWGQKGKLVDGKKLTYQSRWLGEDFNNPSSPGILAGFFIIQAENYEEALTITETHPHTNYGGRIELREIEKL